MFVVCSRSSKAAEAVNALAPCTLPDEAVPLAQQMRMLAEMADYAMRMARVAVEQYEASAAPRPESTTTPSRRQPCPGSIFIRAARVVLNCILGQSRLAAGLSIARPAQPRASAPQPANPTPRAEQSGAEQSRAEPVRQALRSVTRNHPQGPRLLGASLEKLAATLTANPGRAADLPDLFRHICNETGIRLNPGLWRKAARDLTRDIRPAPA
jgi:hypothetical protein